MFTDEQVRNFVANEFREAQRRARGIVPSTETPTRSIGHRDIKPGNVPNTRRRIVEQGSERA